MAVMKQFISDGLTKRQAEVYQLYKLDNKTMNDIAKQLDISISTVQSHIERARDKIL